MALIDDVFDAHGGLDRWRSLRRFTVHFSLNGQLLAAKGRGGALKELAAQGCTRSPSLRLTGFPDADKCVAYRPDRVSIETMSGAMIASREDPRHAFHRPPSGAPWDDLHVAYFCGISIWNCLAAPFLLAEPDVEIEELAPWPERNEIWRRLRAVVPARLGSLAPELIAYFDRAGLQRRTDYAAVETEGSIAQYSWAHHTFSGVVVPTLHRGLLLLSDGTIVRKPPRLDIEIFDAQFD